MIKLNIITALKELISSFPTESGLTGGGVLTVYLYTRISITEKHKSETTPLLKSVLFALEMRH